ncbi:MAG TPA: DUF805 domain-containing protein [Allosphingosinicella sp.]|jgi:uncharacterized membrane protein YhaH (DUF805 family)|nr:DUF805 domain-containing protein [Allosphingosinicella sp.]
MHWMLMPLRRYAEFTGRSRRKEYWLFYLLNVLVGLCVGLAFVVGYLADMSQSQMDTYLMPLVYLACLYGLVTLIPGLAVTVRRLHDTDRSGWNLLWGLLPLVGGFILLYFYVSDGDSGPNRFGPDPKGVDVDGGIFA